MSTGQEGEERIPDEFEAHARIWRTQESLAEAGAQIVEMLGLDPELAERLHFAGVESDNPELTKHAAADLLGALNKRLEEDPKLAAYMRDSFNNDPEAKEALGRGLASLAAWAEEPEEEED